MASSPEGCSVAIIGGGVTGAVVAWTLCCRLGAKAEVALFDQGRSLGGRTSHRRLLVGEDSKVTQLSPVQDVPPGSNVYAFDHGCQLFRADRPEFAEIVKEWMAKGICAEWCGNFGVLKAASAPGTSSDVTDFFGLQQRSGPVYTGVRGMHSVVHGLVREAEATGKCSVFAQARVQKIDAVEGGGWRLSGPPIGHEANFHDTSEEKAGKVLPNYLCEGKVFKVLVVTDPSASFGEWHRASAGGVPRHIADKVLAKPRIPLFTALVVFEDAGLRSQTKLDAITFEGDAALWFAARTDSKDGFEAGSVAGDCWTLVSNPNYAVAEIERVPMRDPETGAFRPQDPEYLRTGPCQVLLDAFAAQLRAHIGADFSLPAVAHLSGQRWGSAFPAPKAVPQSSETAEASFIRHVLGTDYDSNPNPRLLDAPEAPVLQEEDFFHDDDVFLAYAGDYCSDCAPGVESAAMSALHAAKHVHSWISSG